jgi:hypothetical protein
LKYLYKHKLGIGNWKLIRNHDASLKEFVNLIIKKSELELELRACILLKVNDVRDYEG